jgi:hypothetical protein
MKQKFFVTLFGNTRCQIQKRPKQAECVSRALSKSNQIARTEIQRCDAKDE